MSKGLWFLLMLIQNIVNCATPKVGLSTSCYWYGYSTTYHYHGDQFKDCENGCCGTIYMYDEIQCCKEDESPDYSGAVIAGIVIGSVIGSTLLLICILMCVYFVKKMNKSNVITYPMSHQYPIQTVHFTPQPMEYRSVQQPTTQIHVAPGPSQAFETPFHTPEKY